MIFTKKHLDARAADRPEGYRKAVLARSLDLGNGYYRIEPADLRALWEVYGVDVYRALWKEFHGRGLRGEIDADFLASFARRLVCGECRAHWDAIVAKTPPADDLFAWTVDRHNEVNARLSKPTLTVEDARARWTVDTPSK